MRLQLSLFPQLQHNNITTHALELKILNKKDKHFIFLLFSRYKNNVLIDAKAHPDKYTAESNYNMHSLEIKK